MMATMIGWTELLVVLFVALLVFGATWIPKIAHRTGKAIHDFKEAISDVQKQVDKEVDAGDKKK